MPFANYLQSLHTYLQLKFVDQNVPKKFRSKYFYPIISVDYVKRHNGILFKRMISNGGC